MSHLSRIFEEAPIKVQNRNGFDLSHVHAGTSKCGQLVPVLTKLLVPNSTISLGVNAEVNLPPIVAPFYGKVDFAIEGFVVPCSILYGGWKQFISNNEATQFPATQSALLDSGSQTITDIGRATSASTVSVSNFEKKGYALPYVKFTNIATAAGTLTSTFNRLSASGMNIYNYMGYSYPSGVTFSTTGTTDIPISLLPALAYHKICDTFYRNTKLTKTWFEVNPNWNFTASASGAAGYGAAKNVSLIWHSWYADTEFASVGTEASASVRTSSPNFDDISSTTFPDGVSIFSTRQRTYMRDYFTSAVQSPQQGGASVLRFNVDSDGDGQFTINSLRMANALQKFLETNNLSGDYAEMIRNRWGVRPIDADFDEPHYLGRVVVPVYQHTVYKQDTLTNDQPLGNENPFSSRGILGSEAAVAKANAEGSICDNFNVSSWSYLMVLASLVPHANYNYGLSRELTMTKLGDFPAPELQTVGAEEIKNYELGRSNSGATTVENLLATFGYVPRYSRLKYMDDRVSGLLKPGNDMASYQLQRSFRGIPQLSTDFVTIAQDALDGVLSVDTATMGLTCWWEIFFKFHVVMPLADYCIPTLGELQDTHTIKTTVGGSRL